MTTPSSNVTIRKFTMGRDSDYRDYTDFKPNDVALALYTRELLADNKKFLENLSPEDLRDPQVMLELKDRHTNFITGARHIGEIYRDFSLRDNDSHVKGFNTLARDENLSSSFIGKNKLDGSLSKDDIDTLIPLRYPPEVAKDLEQLNSRFMVAQYEAAFGPGSAVKNGFKPSRIISDGSSLDGLSRQDVARKVHYMPSDSSFKDVANTAFPNTYLPYDSPYFEHCTSLSWYNKDLESTDPEFARQLKTENDLIKSHVHSQSLRPLLKELDFSQQVYNSHATTPATLNFANAYVASGDDHYHINTANGKSLTPAEYLSIQYDDPSQGVYSIGGSHVALLDEVDRIEKEGLTLSDSQASELFAAIGSHTEYMSKNADFNRDPVFVNNVNPVRSYNSLKYLADNYNISYSTITHAHDFDNNGKPPLECPYSVLHTLNEYSVSSGLRSRSVADTEKDTFITPGRKEWLEQYQSQASLNNQPVQTSEMSIRPPTVDDVRSTRSHPSQSSASRDFSV